MFEKIWLNICLHNESNNIPCVRSRTRAGVICASIKYIMILLVLRKQFASSAYCVNSWILSDTSVYEYLFIDLWICVFVFSTISIYSRVIVWCTSRIPGYRCGKVLYSHQCALYSFTLIEKDLRFSFVVWRSTIPIFHTPDISSLLIDMHSESFSDVVYQFAIQVKVPH